MSKNLPVKNIATLEKIISDQADNLSALLPADVDLNFMRAQFVAACGANPKLLQECTQSSLVKAIFEACELGLMVHSSLGEAWIIPYKNTATFIPGYKGLVKLAYNSGMVKLIDAQAVFSNDTFEEEYGYNRKCKLIKNHGHRGVKKGVYVLIEMMTGGSFHHYMPIDEIEEIHAKSSAYQYFKRTGKGKEIWGDDHNRLEMDKKAVWRYVSKWIPRSGRRLALALDIDNRQYTGEYEHEDDAEARLYKAVGAKDDTDYTSQLWGKIDALYSGPPTIDDETEVLRIFALMGIMVNLFSEVSHDNAKTLLNLITRAEMLHGKRNTPEENNDRVLRFFRFCLLNQYAITTTREVDDARSAFVEHERESNA